MSISTELTRITNARNTIRTKMVAFGLGEATDTIDDLAAEIGGIADRGTPSATVTEGNSYTIQAGYYHGGTVTGVAGGGSYTLQAKTHITPTTAEQTVTPDTGYYGLSSVQIDAIPSTYKDVSSVTATAGDVLATKTIVTADGTLTPGNMTNNGAVNKTLDATTGNQSYTVPVGYHNGSGHVSIALENKTATPSTSAQDITPTAGKVLSKVTVAKIPDNFGDVNNADAAAANILSGKKAVLKVDGVATLVTGTMTNNGAISGTIDGLSATSYTVPAGYTSGGSVSLTNDIETALAAI